MSQNILLEAFGSIKDKEAREDGVSLVDVLVDGLERVDQMISLDEIDTIVTGMSADVTYALEDAVDEMGLDIDVEAFWIDAEKWADEDDVSYNQGWQNGFTWRNDQVFIEDDDNEEQVLVDATVVLGDAGSSGLDLVRQSRQRGVPAMTFNLDDNVDRDVAYGDDESTDEADESEAAEA